MAVLSYKDFTKIGEKTKTEGSGNFNSTPITYFYLADDGDEAVVRFNVGSEEDLKVYCVHSVEAGGKRRTIACLRESLNEPVDKCPLCAAQQKLYFKAYIEMVSYTPDEKGMIASSVVWERPASFVETLKEYLDNYGDLREELFKIVRKGKKGDQGTTYVIIPLGSKSMVYNATTCPIDFSDFDSYSVFGRAVGQRSAEDMKVFLETGNFPAPVRKSEAQPKIIEHNIPEEWKKNDSFDLTAADVAREQKDYQQKIAETTESQPAQKPGPRRYSF